VRKYADLEVVCGRAQVQLERTSLRAGDEEIERVRGKRVRAWKREG